MQELEHNVAQVYHKGNASLCAEELASTATESTILKDRELTLGSMKVYGPEKCPKANLSASPQSKGSSQDHLSIKVGPSKSDLSTPQRNTTQKPNMELGLTI